MTTDRTSHLQAFGGAVASVACSIGVGFVGVVLSRRGETREYPFLVLWSVPPAVAVYVIAVCANRLRSVTRPLWALVAVGTGAGIGVAWTLLVAQMFGVWLRAADFPVLYCWAIGAAIGLLLATGSNTAGSWIAGSSFVAMLCAILAGLATTLGGPGSELRVYVRGDGDVKFANARAVWNGVLADPTPRGGTRMLAGIQSIALVGSIPSVVLQVDFGRSATIDEALAVEQRVRESPLVERYEWTRQPRH
jgi:hypothetical protein